MSPAQKTRQLFDEKCQRHRRDLEVVFSELNGLMAGMHYQDQTEGSTTPVPSLSPTQTAYGYPLEIFDDFLGHTPASDTACPSEPAIAMESEPMASQWAAIRTLRKETEYHHRRFQVLARRLENPIISDLLEIYPDGQSIRNKGACIVKDVLEGFQPSKLSIVFAFTCFSYSISQLLYKKNAIDKSDILADIRAWRDLITDPKERQAFNQLAPELWPEAKEHLHFIDIPTHPTYGTGRWANRWPQFTSLAASAGYSATELSHPHPNGQTAFGGIDDLQAADTGWSQTSVPGGDVSSTRSEVQPTELDPSNGERESAQSDIKGPEDSKLDNTIMFLVVLVFLQDLGEWYLYTLSGRSLAPKRHKLYQAQQGDQESFHRKAQKAFFEPCSRHRNSSYSAFRALVSVAEMFTRHGYLQSIAEIKQYVISVASAVLLPGTAYEQIVSSVLTISDDVPVAPTQVTHATKPQKRPRAVDEDASSPETGPRPTR
ncbi:hypothetical protein CHGG_08609 [Chaetomium globosum CBS 148.51]|uniref:Uncharacterized protein n=1 Tax=Chaetomium globosum (strain ATCC 6205 / CBS 148.51 / DSM 1962 / NBRC 6347 / NRRL 1970) TaxID=306901 RepID=Q2GTU5_CHAGB|nr:uncharacterized protein CHGG_08609 [Chaetomium globosum CBS 148.51]EAQ84595.1 hypothetical protein CHGG_08609 [Chaetomium globosum CBS 148.51]